MGSSLPLSSLGPLCLSQGSFLTLKITVPLHICLSNFKGHLKEQGIFLSLGISTVALALEDVQLALLGRIHCTGLSAPGSTKMVAPPRIIWFLYPLCLSVSKKNCFLFVSSQVKFNCCCPDSLAH